MVVEATSMQTIWVKRSSPLNCTLCTVCTVFRCIEGMVVEANSMQTTWVKRRLGALRLFVHFVQYVLLQVYWGHGGGGDLYADHLGKEELSAQLYTMYNMYCVQMY